MSLLNFVLPSWAKYAAMAAVMAAAWGHGYVTGLKSGSESNINKVTEVVYKQAKVTAKVTKKYTEKSQKILAKEQELKKEGNSYAIKFPNDDYVFNNYFVWLYNNSLSEVPIPPLSSGDMGASSGVGVSEFSETSVHNNTVGKYWQNRALACEEWAHELEEFYANLR